MKARLSPLDLHSYFVTEVQCTSNPKYRPDDEIALEFSDLQVETRVCDPKTDGNDEEDMWKVILIARQNVGAEKNSPYNFSIILQGWFGTKVEELGPEKTRQLMETTGGSILFGTAREVLRNIMATGPYLPLLLPSVSFHPCAPEATLKPKIAPPKKKLAKKVLRKKKASK